MLNTEQHSRRKGVEILNIPNKKTKAFELIKKVTGVQVNPLRIMSPYTFGQEQQTNC